MAAVGKIQSAASEPQDLRPLKFWCFAAYVISSLFPEGLSWRSIRN